MPLKLDIGDPKSKKTFHIETTSDAFIGKKIGEKIKGGIIKEFSLGDYEFMITGATDNAGFPALSFVEGSGRKKVLLTRGKGLKKIRKKKKLRKPIKGLRKRKTVHGNTIDDSIAQINLKVTKTGTKSLEEIFGKKEKPAEKPKPEEEPEQKKEEAKEEKRKETKEKPEEKKDETQ